MNAQVLIARMLDQMERGIHGRVQLQKLIYFCKVYGIDVDVNYRLYVYGPYSQQVADSLQEGVMEDIFHESKGLISKGLEFQNYLAQLPPEDATFSPQFADVLNTFQSMSIEQLEILATTYFIHQQQLALFGAADKTVVLDKVRRAKSSRFTEDQIINSYSTMEKICLPLARKYA